MKFLLGIISKPMHLFQYAPVHLGDCLASDVLLVKILWWIGIFLIKGDRLKIHDFYNGKNCSLKKIKIILLCRGVNKFLHDYIILKDLNHLKINFKIKNIGYNVLELFLKIVYSLNSI
jgi:hypothetical protein